MAALNREDKKRQRKAAYIDPMIEDNGATELEITSEFLIAMTDGDENNPDSNEFDLFLEFPDKILHLIKE